MGVIISHSEVKHQVQLARYVLLGSIVQGGLSSLSAVLLDHTVHNKLQLIS